MPFIQFRKCLDNSYLLMVLSEMNVGCCQMLFSLSIEKIIWILFFKWLIWWILLIVFQMVNQPCIPEISLFWSWCISCTFVVRFNSLYLIYWCEAIQVINFFKSEFWQFVSFKEFFYFSCGQICWHNYNTLLRSLHYQVGSDIIFLSLHANNWSLFINMMRFQTIL